MSSHIGRRALLFVIVSMGSAGAAMLRYPGGTTLDASTGSYSLSRNFLSDLGMTVAFNGHPNRLGAALFVLSVLLLVVGLGGAAVSIVRYLSSEPGARRWAHLAGVSTVLACAAFTGVAVTPENRVMALHVSFTFWAWRIVPAISLFLALASRSRLQLRRRGALVWFVATLVLAGYAALLNLGPSGATPAGLLVQVVAQKCATVVLILTLLISAVEVDRARSEKLLLPAR